MRTPGSRTATAPWTFDRTISASAIAGLPAVANELSAAGGGVLYIRGTSAPVVFPATPIVLLGLSNVRIVVSDGAQFVGNVNNTGVTTAAGVTRYPSVIFDTCSDVAWEGGNYTTASGAPNYSGTFMVSNGCNRVTIRKTYHNAVSAWPILVSPTYQLPGGSLVNSAGITDFAEEYNTFVGCGFTSGPDGGGVRLANDSGSGTFYQCSRAFLGRGSKVINSNIFAYDIMNSTQYGWDSIFIEGYDIDFGTAVSSPQKIGINLERLTDTTHLNGKVYIGPGRVSGAFKGIQVQSGWKHINIDRPVAEYSYQTGIYIDGTIQGLNVSGPICRNNNQGGVTTGNSLRCGMFIGSDANIGTLQNGQVQGGQYFDDQATPTQLYGVVYGAISGASMLNFLIQGTASGMFGNKTSNAILEVTGGTITNVTVVN